jgi:hypothetical protein
MERVLVTINHHYVITINHSSPLIWVNYNDLTATELWNHGLFFGKSSPNGRTIQVGELL